MMRIDIGKRIQNEIKLYGLEIAVGELAGKVAWALLDDGYDIRKLNRESDTYLMTGSVEDETHRFFRFVWNNAKNEWIVYEF